MWRQTKDFCRLTPCWLNCTCPQQNDESQKQDMIISSNHDLDIRQNDESQQHTFFSNLINHALWSCLQYELVLKTLPVLRLWQGAARRACAQVGGGAADGVLSSPIYQSALCGRVAAVPALHGVCLVLDLAATAIPQPFIRADRGFQMNVPRISFEYKIHCISVRGLGR